jgi:hypothetical protein
MARSIKKRILGAKPKSRKAQLKFIKRMESNNKVLNNLQK